MTARAPSTPSASSTVSARWNSASSSSALVATNASSIPTRRSATIVIAVVVTTPYRPIASGPSSAVASSPWASTSASAPERKAALTSPPRAVRARKLPGTRRGAMTRDARGDDGSSRALRGLLRRARWSGAGVARRRDPAGAPGGDRRRRRTARRRAPRGAAPPRADQGPLAAPDAAGPRTALRPHVRAHGASARARSGGDRRLGLASDDGRRDDGRAPPGAAAGRPSRPLPQAR